VKITYFYIKIRGKNCRRLILDQKYIKSAISDKKGKKKNLKRRERIL
jgi:hypothetical protein